MVNELNSPELVDKAFDLMNTVDEIRTSAIILKDALEYLSSGTSHLDELDIGYLQAAIKIASSYAGDIADRLELWR